ncbi:reverse transcriptase-like protein [Gottfriedia luciferensis]|uniref:reverse transcriptase-like protein n=1 Tax=Gottfriedia luciferensis TaxID=178774 RepID=UPI000B434B63|nr:reverse transcriptase-like protein [Gottfriedia luciferensis]
MKLKIVWKYQTKKKYQITLETDWLETKEALLLAEDFESTGRTKEIIFLDQFDSQWTKKQVIKYLKELEEEPHNITVFFDGGYDLATSISGVGVCIYFSQNGKEYRKRYNEKLEGLMTNNEAEFAALENAILLIEEMNITGQTVVINGDSQVVINQLNGSWPCFEEQHERFINRIEKKCKELKLTLQFELIRRNDNKEAHNLATQALKGNKIISTIEVT